MQILGHDFLVIFTFDRKRLVQHRLLSNAADKVLDRRCHFYGHLLVHQHPAQILKAGAREERGVKIEEASVL